MEHINYSDLRKNLKSILNKTCDDHAPILITRQSAKPVVLMSLEDFMSIEETHYLLKSPKNLQRLEQSLQEINDKKDLIIKDIDDL
jgi:antitoxin YefM